MNVLQLARVLVLSAFVLAACGSDDDSAGTPGTTTTETTATETTTTEPTTTAPPAGPIVVRIRVVDGAPEGGIVRRSVDHGDRVVLVVTSDVADEVHLHGYDLSREIAAGGTARVGFRATLPGRFEVELEERGVQIADLTVNP